MVAPISPGPTTVPHMVLPLQSGNADNHSKKDPSTLARPAEGDLQPPEEVKEAASDEVTHKSPPDEAQEPNQAEAEGLEDFLNESIARNAITSPSERGSLQEIGSHEAQPSSESQAQLKQFPRAIAQEMLVKRETAHVSFFDQSQEMSAKAKIVFLK